MTRVLLLLALAGVVLWLVDRPRRRSYRVLVRRCYRRMDVALGVKADVLEHRAGQRRKYGWILPGDLVNFLWPQTQYGGIAALPFFNRRERYIHLHLRPVPWPRRYFTWHVQGVTAGWTTEVDASMPGFIERAERGFADFLFLKYRPGIFTVHDHRDNNPPSGWLTLTRAKPAPVPDELHAHEELVD